MKGKYTTWIMLLLLLALLGLTAWMFWAIQKIEGDHVPGRRISMTVPSGPDH
jgi:cbb3-type cytochrome oxidase subunit 3